MSLNIINKAMQATYSYAQNSASPLIEYMNFSVTFYHNLPIHICIMGMN